MVQWGSSRTRLRAGTGRNGTFTQVESTFFTVRSSGVLTAGAPDSAAPPPSAPATDPRNQSRRVRWLLMYAPLPDGSVSQSVRDPDERMRGIWYYPSGGGHATFAVCIGALDLRESGRSAGNAYLRLVQQAGGNAGECQP